MVDPSKISQLKIIESGILSTFSDLLTKLGDTTEQGSRLLDQTAVLFGSNLAARTLMIPGTYRSWLRVANTNTDATLLMTEMITLPLQSVCHTSAADGCRN